MLIPNTLFRMGGAAIMLTSKETERPRAKYELQHLVRVHLGADDVAYECVFQREDDRGVVGVELNRDLVKVAGRALERNLTKMGPLVLPLAEQLKSLISSARSTTSACTRAGAASSKGSASSSGCPLTRPRPATTRFSGTATRALPPSGTLWAMSRPRRASREETWSGR